MREVGIPELVTIIGEQAVEIRLLRRENAALRERLADTETLRAVVDKDGDIYTEPTA